VPASKRVTFLQSRQYGVNPDLGKIQKFFSSGGFAGATDGRRLERGESINLPAMDCPLPPAELLRPDLARDQQLANAGPGNADCIGGFRD